MDKYARYPPILVPLWKSQVAGDPQQNKVGSMAGKTTWHDQLVNIPRTARMIKYKVVPQFVS